jgi:hypothetical protein
MSITLESLIGTEIVAFVPAFHPSQWQKLKLVNVEQSGIWVENRALQDGLLKESRVIMSPKSAVFFLPFSSVVYVLASLDLPYVSDEAVR